MDATKPYAAKIRTPFAVLGIRTAGGAVTGIECLPGTVCPKAPGSAPAERVVRPVERWLLAHEGYRFGAR